MVVVYWRSFILAELYRFVLQSVEEARLFTVYGALRNVRYQNDALPPRCDVRMSMRQVELTLKLLTGRILALWMT